MSKDYRISVVVDREYGAQLADLAQTGPVWIVDTPPNRAAAERIWAAAPRLSHLQGVTTFKFAPESSDQDILMSQLNTIDLHHSEYSSDPPYTILEIIGTHLTSRLKAELSEFGFHEFEETSYGFRAVRLLPSND